MSHETTDLADAIIELRELRAACAEKDAEQTSCKESRKSLESEVGELNAEIVILQTTLAAAEQERDDLFKVAASSRDELTAMRAKLAAAERREAEKAQRIAELVRYNLGDGEQVCVPAEDGAWVLWTDLVRGERAIRGSLPDNEEGSHVPIVAINGGGILGPHESSSGSLPPALASPSTPSPAPTADDR